MWFMHDTSWLSLIFVLQARDEGKSRGLWLLVNVQNQEDFECHKLNRDVWANDNVRALLKDTFLLWQVWCSDVLFLWIFCCNYLCIIFFHATISIFCIYFPQVELLVSIYVKRIWFLLYICTENLAITQRNKNCCYNIEALFARLGTPVIKVLNIWHFTLESPSPTSVSSTPELANLWILTRERTQGNSVCSWRTLSKNTTNFLMMKSLRWCTVWMLALPLPLTSEF